MKLTDELDFYIEESGSGYKWELAHKPRYTNPWSREKAEQIKQQILDDHEKARSFETILRAFDVLDYQSVLSKYMRLFGENKQNQKLPELIEKLLQRIDADILAKDKLFFCDECDCRDNIKEELQKLLENKNG